MSGWAELKEAAEAATDGPWKACGTIYEHMNAEVRSGIKGEGQGIAQVWDGPNAFPDARYIALANPATIKALIADYERVRGERDELLNESADLTKALTGLTCGGSEFFVRKGDRYVADIAACVNWVRRAKQDAHRMVVEAVKARKAAEDRQALTQGESA